VNAITSATKRPSAAKLALIEKDEMIAKLIRRIHGTTSEDGDLAFRAYAAFNTCSIERCQIDWKWTPPQHKANWYRVAAFIEKEIAAAAIIPVDVSA
jgi:hypothetical protein